MSKISMTASSGLVRPLFWISGGRFLFVSTHGKGKERALWSLFCKSTYPIHEGCTLLTQSPPKGPTLGCHHIGRLEFQLMNFEEIKYSVHNKERQANN